MDDWGLEFAPNSERAWAEEIFYDEEKNNQAEFGPVSGRAERGVEEKEKSQTLAEFLGEF